MSERILYAGDIRLMSKADLQLRVQELLTAEERYVATIERLGAENDRLHAAESAMKAKAIAVVNEMLREMQANIDGNIAEVRVAMVNSKNNWSLINARDWLRHAIEQLNAIPLSGDKS
jgi:hypothetical protein